MTDKGVGLAAVIMYTVLGLLAVRFLAEEPDPNDEYGDDSIFTVPIAVFFFGFIFIPVFVFGNIGLWINKLLYKLIRPENRHPLPDPDYEQALKELEHNENS